MATDVFSIIDEAVENPERDFMGWAEKMRMDGFWTRVRESGDYGRTVFSAYAIASAMLKADSSLCFPPFAKMKGIPWMGTVSDSLILAGPVAKREPGGTTMMDDRTLEALSTSLAGIMFSYDRASLLDARTKPGERKATIVRSRTVKETFGSSRAHALGCDDGKDAHGAGLPGAETMIKGLSAAAGVSGFKEACAATALRDKHDGHDFTILAPATTALSRTALALRFDGMPEDDPVAVNLAVWAFGHWSRPMEDAFINVPWPGADDGAVEAAAMILDDGDGIPDFISSVLSLMGSWKGPSPSADEVHDLLYGTPHTADVRNEAIIQLLDFLTQTVYATEHRKGMDVEAIFDGHHPTESDKAGAERAFARSLHDLLIDREPLSFITQDLFRVISPLLETLMYQNFDGIGRGYPKGREEIVPVDDSGSGLLFPAPGNGFFAVQ